jgi:hypothetical protein
MFATVLAAIASFEEVFFGKNDVPFFGKIKFIGV